MSARATRLTGLYAMIAAFAAVVPSPLLALSYFATNEGADGAREWDRLGMGRSCS